MKVLRIIPVVLLTVLIAVPVSAQGWEKARGPNFTYEGVFADTTAAGEALVSGGHGIVVDKYDRVWMGSYYGGNTGGLVVLNADGTPAAFSPIASVTFADTTIDLAVTGSCRGMNVDHEGNILYCAKSTLIKINVENGEGMAYWVGAGSLTKPGVDAEGYIYVGYVVGVSPVEVIDPATFEVTQQITLEPAPGYARGLEISPDGKTLIPANLSAGGPVYIYTTEDYVTYSLTDSLYTDVLGNNIFQYQCVTMDWGPEGKLWISHDDAYAATGQKNNGFVVVDLEAKEYSYLFVPMDSTEYNGPRGIAFNSTGDIAYATSFNANKVWKFAAVEPLTPGDWTYDDGLSNFVYDGVFADTTAAGEALVSGGHGIVVDKYDRVWMGSYYGGNTGGLVVLNADGTPAAFSPIASVTFADTTIDLAVTGSCRGMNVDHEGNILYCAKSTLIKINVENGEGMAYWVGAGSLTKPGVDAEGYIYVGYVVGVSPVEVIDPATFEVTQQITLEPAPGYARGLEISPDGKTLIPANLSAGGPVYIYTTEDYVTYSLTDSLYADNGGYPIFHYQCVTMDWGPEGMLWISHDDAYAATGQDYNGFAIVDLETKKYDYLFVPMDSTEYNGTRGIAFNSTGEIAYATSFNANKVWKFVKSTVGVDVRPMAKIPVDYELNQNYPNPFNPTTTIPFTLKKNGNVQLKVYDIIGREVVTIIDKPMQAGSYAVTFDGSNLASGVYHYRMTVNRVALTKRMLLVK